MTISLVGLICGQQLEKSDHSKGSTCYHINSAIFLQGRSAFVLMPTGGGEWLCLTEQLTRKHCCFIHNLE